MPQGNVASILTVEKRREFTRSVVQVYTEDRRVLNMIQDWCDACRAAAWASLDPDNSRQW